MFRDNWFQTCLIQANILWAVLSTASAKNNIADQHEFQVITHIAQTKYNKQPSSLSISNRAQQLCLPQEAFTRWIKASSPVPWDS